MPIVYPHLEYKSLIRRCNEDITKFLKTSQTAYTVRKLYEPNGTESEEKLGTEIKELLNALNVALKKNDYVSEISHIEPSEQNKLWIDRTYLFYQLLIYATAMCTYETLYMTICKPYYDSCKYNKLMFNFRCDITPDVLKKINLGIFGSLNATSDIDLGLDLEYNKLSLLGPPLAYLVACIESMFFIFTGKSSLKWDIEVYGNLLTLPNPDYNPNDINSNPDYFYLDTSKFTLAHFKQILQPVISGMLRNIMLGRIEDESINSINSSLTNSSKTLLSLLENNTNTTKNTAFKGMVNLLNLADTVDPELKGVFNDQQMFAAAQKDALIYLKLANDDEKAALLEYYTRINNAEQTQIDILVSMNNKLSQLSPENIVEILLAWEKAAIYKMENYISSPTIIHIVRLLQAQKNSIQKYNTTTPLEYCNGKIMSLEPYCIIGKYGYIISILEQIGYIIRFYNMYCIGNHHNAKKCKKKLDKYMDRVDDGIKRLQDISKNEQQSRLQAISKNTQSLKNVISSTRYITPVKPTVNPTVNPSKKNRLLKLASLANKTNGGRRYTKRRSPKKTKTQRKRRH